jgi:hypothetical protein
MINKNRSENDIALCHLIALAVLLAAPVSAIAAEPYEGRWTQDPAWCANTRRNGDEIPITITRQSVEQFASFCRVQAVRRGVAARHFVPR